MKIQAVTNRRVIVALKKCLVIGIYMILIMFLLAGTCDHTKLRGTIVPERAVIKVGETIRLELKVPKELERIKRISWFAEPNEAGTFQEKDEDEDSREVFFTAKKPGKCIICTYGFYKQTNPQPITEIQIEITE